MTFMDRFLPTPGRRFAALALVLTGLRILALVLSDADLGPDEGQYWFWSLSPDLGYFSKPPLIAWTIAATTGIFGDDEWAIRLAAPLYQLGSAVFLFLLCRRLAGPRAAFWAGAAWLTLPGVFLSSALITTDAPLLFFWCAALYFFFVATESATDRRKPLFAVLLGASVGLGFLSKYAMFYFVLGAALALALSPSRRRTLGWGAAAIAVLVALVVFAPNVWWNAAHDFQTVSHTAANANWNGDFGHPDRFLKFLLDQFGVAGPIMLALIALAAFWKSGDAGERDTMRTLLAFSIPAFAVVGAQAFISRAHGNWAAVAYPSAVALATIYALRGARAEMAAKASVALHVAVGIGFLAVFSSFALADATGTSPAFRKLRGWDGQGAQIAALSRSFDAIMTDDREITGDLVYYARDGKPIVAWNPNRAIDSHFEAFYAYDPARHRRVLYVSANGEALYIRNRFRTIRKIGAIDAPTGRQRTRTLYLYEVAGFSG